MALAVVASLFVFWVASYLVKLRKRGAVSGEGSIIGGIGSAMAHFQGEGKIWLEGEAWAANSNVPIEKDQLVVVRAMHGLVLEVEPLPDEAPAEVHNPT